MSDPVRTAFEPETILVAIARILPTKPVPASTKTTIKYRQIEASVREIGVVEPPVVARDRPSAGQYLLLDGHLRLEVLRDLGDSEVVCLVSTDDEGFTYNKRVNRLATLQEHKMIAQAIERGVSEERLAATLGLSVSAIRQKHSLLDGICPEAAELLKDKHCSVRTFATLKRMKPLRQIEAAELMVAANNYTAPYASALLASTPGDQLAKPDRQKKIKGLSPEQIARMEREMAQLQRQFKLVEQSYGTDVLNLVLARGYLAKLLDNPRVTRYLSQHHSEILAEFQTIVDTVSMDAKGAA